MPIGKVRRGVAVLVVTHDDGTDGSTLTSALGAFCGPQDQIVFVDNGDPRAGGSAERIASLEAFVAAAPESRELVRLGANRGFATAANRGLARTDRPFVVVLHPDMAPTPGWLDALLAPILNDPKIAAVGLAPDLERGASREIAILSGPCRLFDREALLAAGGWDERYFFGGEDAELSLRFQDRGARMIEIGGVSLTPIAPGPVSAQEGLRRRNLRLQGGQLLADHLHGQSPDEALRIASAAEGDFAPDRARVSIVMPVLDNLSLTRRAVESIYEYTHHDFELILVDNGSVEDVRGYAEKLSALKPNLRYLRNHHNEGFGFASNQGLAVATGSYLVLINNDVTVTPGWLARMIALARLDPKIGLVGPRSNRVSGPQQIEKVPYSDADDAPSFSDRRAREHAGSFQLQTRIAGLCVLMPRAVMDEVGGFDPCYWLGNFEDDDLCLRVNRRGYVCAIADDVFVHHEGSATFKEAKVDYERLMRDNWRWFQHKWDYAGALGAKYPARDLALKKPFSYERDVVPVDSAEVFSPASPPIALGAAMEHRLLLFAERGETGWKGRLTEYLTTVRAEDPVTLLLRIEPPSPAVINATLVEIEAVVAQLEDADPTLDAASRPDVLIETTSIPPRKRGGLYTAATALLSAESHRARLYRREAEACGVPVVETVATVLAPT